MDETLNALVPVRIRVIGVASECLGNGCLARERALAGSAGRVACGEPRAARCSQVCCCCFFFAGVWLAGLQTGAG